MKFTEEKLERAFTGLLGLEGLSSFQHHKLDNLKMSSLFANKLDRSTIFAFQYKDENS
jgi:hypothetical protein